MTINKAYKFRMYPTKEQENIINCFIGTTRFIYNHYLYENKNNDFFNYCDASKDLVNLKEENEWLKEVDSCICQNAIRDLSYAFDRYNKNLGGYPKFKKKGYSGSYRTNEVRNTYKGKSYSNIEVNIKDKIIKLPKLGKVKIRGYRKLEEFPYKIYNATISKEAGRYYVSVCVSLEVETKENKERTAVGIDLGVKTLVTTSDGIKYDKIDIKKEEKRIVKLNRKLAKAKKGSNNYKKLVIKIERENQKIKNKRKYYTHKITKELVKENDIIITETLKVKEMIEKGKNKLAKHITNSSLSEIIRQLTYKAKWNNKILLQLNTYYESSQICNHCEYKNKKVKDLSVREWECPNCGNKNDRDINASLNIMWEGIKIYYKKKYSV